MSRPTIAQMANRANDGHRKALRACRADTLAVGMTASMAEIRGMRTVLATLRRWGCIDGDALTERGRELLVTLERPLDSADVRVHEDAGHTLDWRDDPDAGEDTWLCRTCDRVVRVPGWGVT